MEKNTFIFHPQTELSFEILQAVYLGQITQFRLSKESKECILKSRQTVDHVIEQNQEAYGINTGFGKLAQQRIKKEEYELLQYHLIQSHAAGVGEPLTDDIVRLILFLKIHSLALGYSGVHIDIIEHLLQLLNQNIYPVIPAKGSVGASGDLAPLAHIGLVLLGEGQVRFNKKIMAIKDCIKNFEPCRFRAKDGLALLNGTQVSTAIALANLICLEKAFYLAIESGSLTTLVTASANTPFQDQIHQIRKQLGQIKVAHYFREYFGCYLSDASIRVQDPYCIRCQPQVMGACLDQIDHAKIILIREANSVTDNPLVFTEDNRILSGGNFHAEPVAFIADLLALVIAEIGSITERRIAFLMDTHLSHLPAFLAHQPGLQSGLMIAQVTTAALVSENKTLAHPASIDSIPTSANQEDHVSMATFAAQRLGIMLNNLQYIIAIEFLAACQAVDLKKIIKLPPLLKKRYHAIRKVIPYYQDNSALHLSIEKMYQFLFKS